MNYQSTTHALRAELARERSVLRNVYLWMTLGLAITGVVAMYVAGNPALLRSLVLNRGAFFGLVIGQLALVFFLSARVNAMSPTAATLSFAGYAVLNGITLSVIFLVYTGASVATAFFVTAGTFAALSVYAITTNRELGSWGQYLFGALIGLIIASLVNYFLRSPGLDYLISFAGVFIFMGLTAYDTQMIKRMSAAMGPNVDEADFIRVSILGALRLYLDFINLFLYLLRFFGRRD